MKKGLWAALLLLAVGLALRLVLLGEASYTIDEINVVRDAVGQKSVSAIYQTELARFTSYHRLPFLMVIIHVWMKAFGPEGGGFPAEFDVRLPFALFGTLSLPLFFLLGRAAGGVRAGWWLFGLATLNIFHVFYSREAYDYVLVMGFTAAVLWAGLRLLDEWEKTTRFNWRIALVGGVASWGLLQSHLSGLLFLAPWNALLALALFQRVRRQGSVASLVPWLLVFAVPYLIFMPFVLRVFNFVTTESPVANRVSWALFPALLGRMGWGERLFALLPFLLCVIAGGIAAWRGGRTGSRPGRWLLLQAAAFFLIQTYALRVSRFEVRYYAPLAPVLLLLAAWGLSQLQDRIKAPRVARWFPAAAAAFILLLTAPSLRAVCQLQCRGYNYKGLAKWLNANLPENGIYSYWNVYDGRGVPAVYPTPGRHMAYPVPWSSAEDYKQLAVRDRLTSFFHRFPTAAYVETTPVDVLAPAKVTCAPISRESLFTRQVWLEDPAYQFLVRWRTLPLGEAQWESTHMDKMLVCLNKPEDLPALARKRGQSLYHCFGNEWQYYKDQQTMNDWLITTQGGTFQIGNVTTNPVPAVIKFAGFGHPAGCLLNIYSSSGGQIITNLSVPSQPREVQLPVQQLPPGRTEFFVEVVAPTNGTKTTLLVYSVAAAPSAP